MAGRVAAQVAIIGAGYAGMTAAVELADAGIVVEVFEASRTLGGRARAVEIEGVTVDNGAHILVGAYRETLRLMRKVGVPEAALQRHPLHLEYPGEFRLRAPGIPVPAPLHLAWALLAARGLSWPEKLAAIRFMHRLEKRCFRLDVDMTVADLLAAHRQPARVSRHLWEPLCVAALNTPIEEASAQVFLNVLRDSLAADRAASDLLLPATDFSSLFSEPAARFIEARGGRVHRGARIAAILRQDDAWMLDGHGPYERIIIGVAPQHLNKLIAGLPELAPIAAQVARFAWQPIATRYLAYPETVRLPFAMVGTSEGWLFDRGRTHGRRGLISAVISASWEDTPASAIHREIARIVPNPPLPRWTRMICEKRATFACTPGLQRPTTATALPGLWLAGDYVAGDYPATIEGAVRSGVAAARALIAERN
ncbi:MAG: hydroxysqualene dehydroxylase HpnE [Candidatus Nitricoxidivorans perseverans]|uniref:Hydroxysqualene dehydroxylase HpnE n=1 Tax=Candidatus Nitricoxidivorans perseverans TaxID=2975601 RepID=A0AA49FMS4_9PROT|nr:MAG: hydroxysqualene dehydroxylase HpnE [Candidatus Nitricoxidivorans perseverans]